MAAGDWISATRCLQGEMKLGFEIEIFGFIARRIGISDVRRDQFLALADKRQIAVKLIGKWI